MKLRLSLKILKVQFKIQSITEDTGEEVKIVIDSIVHGAAHTIGKGEKFAQLVLVEVPKAALFKVEKVLGIGENRGGGFGSSGLK